MLHLNFVKMPSINFVSSSKMIQIQQKKILILSFNLLLLLFLQSIKITRAGPIPAVIVFGDSTVDTGNNNYIPTLGRSNFKPYGRDFYGAKPTGRFSNGRLVPDFISEALGLPTIPAFLDPEYTIKNFASGVCFASGGSGFDNETGNFENIMTLSKQLEKYKQYQDELTIFQGEVKAQETIREALHIISLGTNDFIENYFAVPGGRSSQFTVSEYEDFIVKLAEDFVRDIYKLGARKLGINGFGPFGCIPLQRTMNPPPEINSPKSGEYCEGKFNIVGGCKENYNAVAQELNEKFKNLVNMLTSGTELSDMIIVFADVYDLGLDMIQNPCSYGFENSVLGCCGSGRMEGGYLCNEYDPRTCVDASKYLFWDAGHPTEKAYHIIADHIMKSACPSIIDPIIYPDLCPQN